MSETQIVCIIFLSFYGLMFTTCLIGYCFVPKSKIKKSYDYNKWLLKTSWEQQLLYEEAMTKQCLELSLMLRNGDSYKKKL